MKGTPERQHLEEALTGERAGSPKIQALADYAMRKEVQWREAHRPVGVYSAEARARSAQRAIAEGNIAMGNFRRDIGEYFEALDNAEEILRPYEAIDNPDVNPYQLFLDDLREINRGKG